MVATEVLAKYSMCYAAWGGVVGVVLANDVASSYDDYYF